MDTTAFGPHDMPPPAPVSNPSPTQTHASSDAGGGNGSGNGGGQGAMPGSSAASAGLGSLPPPPPGMGPHDPNQPGQSRPCDICRQRKTRCVREDGKDKCVMCTFHGQPCTYLRGPLPRKRRKATDPAEYRSQPNGSGSGSVPGMTHLNLAYSHGMGMAIPLDHHEEIE
jgi:Zn(2)-Cys(6) binuclear cluster domain-containing protein